MQSPDSGRASLAHGLDGHLAALSSARHDDHTIEEGDTKIDVHGARRVEEAVRIRVVDRLDANDVRAGRQASDRELALRIQREAADHRSGRRVEGDDMRAEDWLAVLGDLPRDA